MKVRLRCYLFLLAVTIPINARSQSTRNVQSVRDAQAVSILSQCLKAGGGESEFAKVKDFRADGNITYFWGGREVKGAASMQGRAATEEFRIDANLSGGTRSVVIGKGGGKVAEANGRSKRIPYHNAINLGALNFPFIAILGAINDTSTSITLVGQVSVEGREAYQIHTQRSFADQGDPQGILSHLSGRDFLIDTSSYLPISAKWMTHPPDDYRQELPQQIIFGDFRSVNDVLVPFRVSESIYGQNTWVFQADQVKLNTGLPNHAFDR